MPFDWIIYFGDGDTCDQQDCDELCDVSTTKVGGICEGIKDDFSDLIDSSIGQVSEKVIRCYFARVQCGSDFLEGTPTITPQSILCREIPYFERFGRIFLPLCTLDWFLGRGDTRNATSTRFRGAYVVDQLLETLERRYNISQSNLVVLSGTRGGALGALHSAKYIRDKLNGPKVITLADGAWFVDLETFSPRTETVQDAFDVDTRLRRESSGWIGSARLNDDCLAKWNAGGPGIAAPHRCLFVPELLPFLANEKIMFIHAQYDLLFLSSTGLLDETAESRFFDAESYALRAISYVESFGSVVRSSTLDAASPQPDNHYFFMPSCGTPGYLIPTSLHAIGQQTIDVASAGSIQIRRDIKTWENLTIGNLAVRDAVGQWIQNAGNQSIIPTSLGQLGDGVEVGMVQDKCRGFLCNPTCTESILPFRVSAIFSPCAQNIILAYALLLMCTLWLAFAWGYFRVRLFRHNARSYWTAFRTGKPLPDFGYFQLRERMAMEQSPMRDENPSSPQKSPSDYQPIVPPMNTSSTTTTGGPLSPIPASPPPGLASPPPGLSPLMSDSMLPRIESSGSSAMVASVAPEGDDEIDMVALANDLTSPDKKVRAAAKKKYKELQKATADRRKADKDKAKTQAQQEYEAREREARRQFEERQAAMGLQAQQAKAQEEEEKRKKEAKKGATKKTKEAEKRVVSDDVSNVVNPFLAQQATPATTTADPGAGKIQRKAEEEILMEAASLDYRKVHLMVRDLSYWAPPRQAKNPIRRLFSSSSSEVKYQILRNVDLAVKPGQMHALMGPSGSGKSTLLDVLALIRDSGEMKGAHYINGVRSHARESSFLRDWLRHNVAYVRQTDVLFPRMTVREHLQHAAWLLLPQFMPDMKKLRRVQQVIELLELDACSETICGDGGVKIEGGISGGQRRRVSVATQLLRLPACMLLDEPTSGLDSTNALLLCKSLHTLAHRGGLTIVMTIHQPRNEIFNLFDQLTVLVGGRIVFSGSPAEAPIHFSIDTNERQDISVADALLDKLAVAPENEVKGFEALYATGPLGRRMAEEMKAEATDFDEQTAHDLQEVLRESALGEGRWSWESPSSAAMQMWVLMSRTMRRGGFDLRKSMILAFIGGCVVGLCFVGIGSVTSRTALAYLTVATMTFLQGAFLGDRYLAEKQMYDHESAAGSAVQWTAFLASQFVRDSVTSASEALSFGIPAYWIGGMFPAVDRFLIFLVLIVLIAHVCISSNVLVEIDRDNLRAAALVNVAYVGLGALFNGFIIQLRDLPVYLSWLPYIMVTYWGFAGILVNDFTGETFKCTSSVLECATRTGDVFIVAFSFDAVDPYVSMLALLIMIIIFRTCAVADFFFRYVRGRGKGLKLLSGGNTLEDDALKNVPKRAAAFGKQAVKLGSAMKSMISNRGDLGKRMVEQAKQKNQQDTERVVAKMGKEGIAFNEEWDYVATGEGAQANSFQVAAKEPFYRAIFQSRAAMVALCIFDIGFLGVVCTIPVGTSWNFFFFMGVSSVIGVIFMIQFIISLCFMVPITPTGPKDCTWAGTNDAVAFLATIGDFAIIIQMWSGNAYAPVSDPLAQANNALTFLILSGLSRGTRLIRVYNFWYKVARYHEIRAVSWLMAADQEKEKKMEEFRRGGVGNDPAARISQQSNNRAMAKSMRIAAANPMWSAYGSSSGPAVVPPNIDPSSF